jgi:predicted Zn finger-like uncharacterized protein
MARVTVNCPKCQARYSVDQAALGKKTRCKREDCGAAFVLTHPAERDPARSISRGASE